MEDAAEKNGEEESVAKRLADRVTGPIDAFQIVTESDEEKADAALESLLERDAVEDQSLAEMMSARPLADPDRFGATHRRFVRALEVYDRNSRLPPSRLRAGVLTPLARPFVLLFIAIISDRYLRRVVEEVRRLYALREASSPVGGREHRLLTTARRQMDRLQPDFTGSRLTVPAFLVGGAALSGAASVLQNALRSGPGRLVLLFLVLLLTVGAFWCIITAAAITRRRTRLVLDEPLRALWDAVGSAGRPPKDSSRTFVAVAGLLLVVGWVIAPIVAAAFSRFGF